MPPRACMRLGACATLFLACASAGATQLAGVVRDTVGQPVAGALVVAASETELKNADGTRQRWIATSDASGRFAFDGFPAGACRVSANAGPGRVGIAAAPCRVDASDAAIAADVVVAQQPEHASGHLQRPAGAKAADGDVVLLARYPAGEDDAVTVVLGAPVVADSWSLELPAGSWMAKAVTAAGDSRMAQFALPGRATPVELRFATASIAHPELARELHAMVVKDQDAREKFIAAGREDAAALAPMERIDRANVARLKQIVHRHGWPTSAMIGDDGMGDLWLLAQHAPQDFIAIALPHLKAAADRGEIGWSSMALMIDRDLVNRHKPQVYGSQGHLEDGHFVLFNVADAPRLDERRAQVGLGPIADYKALIEKEYRKPASAN